MNAIPARAVRLGLAVAAVMAGAVIGAQQAPPRDVKVPVLTGTAVISGAIVQGDKAQTPLPNVLVRLSRTGVEDIRTSVTDEAGRYTFSSLPAGTYSLVASKGAFITTEYGSPRAGLPGYSIAVSDGEALAVKPIALVRGGVIAGRITDAAGRPVEQVVVEAVQFFDLSGERKRRAGAGFTGRASTNIHGEYRIYGLLPGEYLVLAAGNSHVPPEATPQQMRWADKPTGAAPAPLRPAKHAPTFYPGVVATAAARPVALAPGQERLGVDVTVQSVPVARVSGTIVGVDGRPAARATIWWTERLRGALGYSSLTFARTDNDGQFRFSDLAPGEYTLTAQASSTPSGRGAVRGAFHWGLADVTVSGSDVDGLTVTLQAGLTLDGRIAIAGSDAPVGLPGGVAVRLAPSGNLSVAVGFNSPSTSSEEDGSFVMGGILPGRYRLSVLPPAPVRDTWLPASAMLGGRDLLDLEVDIDPSTDRSDLVITLSNRMASLAGTLTDAAGRPMSGLRVLIFSANPDHWWPSSRRVHNAPVDDRGAYAVPGLPAGDYLLVALTEVERSALYEPSYLEQFVPFGIKVTIAEGEQRRQDLRVGR